MSNNEKPTVTKIEFDEVCGEPKLVEVQQDDLPNLNDKKKARIEKIKLSPSKMQEPDMNSYPKQLSMKQVFVSDESISKKQNLIKKVFYILFVVMLFAVIAVTAYKDFFANDEPLPSWQEILGIVTGNWFYIILALVALFFSFFFKGLKLSVTCKSLTGKWHFKTCMETGIIGHYYNNVTPLGAGGQPFEIYHLSKHGVHGGVAASLPIATFFMYQFSFMLLGVFFLFTFSPDIDLFRLEENSAGILSSPIAIAVRPLASLGLVFCMVMPIIVIVFSLLPRPCSKLVHAIIHLGGKFRLVKNPRKTTFKTMKTVVHNSMCIKAIIHNPLVFIVSVIIGFCEQFAQCSIAYFVLKFFGFNWQPAWHIWEWISVVQICVLLYAAISFIPTPGNSGAADLSFFWLFGTGLQAGLAFPAMLVWRFLSYYSYIIVGIVFTRLKKRSDKKRRNL